MLFMFVNDVVEAIETNQNNDGEYSVLETFTPIMSLISTRFASVTLTDPSTFNNVQLLRLFQCRNSLADVSYILAICQRR